LTTALWNELVRAIVEKADKNDVSQQLQEITNQSGSTGEDVFTRISTIENDLKKALSQQTALESKLLSIEQEWQKRNTFAETPEMVFVKGGKFLMSQYNGSNPRLREVTLDDFYISKYPITQEQWMAVMGTNPCTFAGRNMPVEKVNWHDANLYAFRLGLRTGKKYRLPTEAEWEYAALGNVPFEYAGSPDVNEVAWHSGNANGRPQPVGTKKPNDLGLYDMSGNVWEWCMDWHSNYTNTAVTNPIGAPTGTAKVLRGGSWADIAGFCVTICHGNSDPNVAQGHTGFRLVMLP
jgi:formylglycine-generating enzyme required for sulfatase activity